MTMKTLHVAYRVNDLVASLAFYEKVGFREIGRVVLAEMTLVMLNLPGDDDVVTLELVHEPGAGHIAAGNGFSHLVVQVDDLDATLAGLDSEGISHDQPLQPGGPNGPKTSFLWDPDGYRIELVEWPSGHGDGLTRADFL